MAGNAPPATLIAELQGVPGDVPSFWPRGLVERLAEHCLTFVSRSAGAGTLRKLAGEVAAQDPFEM